MSAVYLAARYDRRLEMLGHAQDLERLGHRLTSRWVFGLHEGVTDPLTLGRCAAEDLYDIARAETFVTFTETPDVGHTSGGRHVELGYAFGYGLRIIVLGPPENVFHHHARVQRFDTWADALAWLP